MFKHSAIRSLLLGLVVLSQSMFVLAVSDGITTQTLLSDVEDTNTPESNSTVWVGGCVGTLIQPDMIITAGHCVYRPAGFYAEDGRWYSTSALINRLTTDNIGFGNDRRNFSANVRATHFTILNGVDIALLALETPVSAEIARPKKVLTDAPADILWSTQSFLQVGWGTLSDTEGAPTIRRERTATFKQCPCYLETRTYRERQAGKFCVSGSTVLPENSGGPLYWIDETGVKWLIGVAQGKENGGGRFVPTFLQEGDMASRGDATVYEKPDISSFLKERLLFSASAQITEQNTIDFAPIGTLN